MCRPFAKTWFQRRSRRFSLNRNPSSTLSSRNTLPSTSYSCRWFRAHSPLESQHPKKTRAPSKTQSSNQHLLRIRWAFRISSLICKIKSLSQRASNLTTSSFPNLSSIIRQDHASRLYPSHLTMRKHWIHLLIKPWRFYVAIWTQSASLVRKSMIYTVIKRTNAYRRIAWQKMMMTTTLSWVSWSVMILKARRWPTSKALTRARTRQTSNYAVQWPIEDPRVTHSRLQLATPTLTITVTQVIK
jgi:hypothetical protein